MGLLLLASGGCGGSRRGSGRGGSGHCGCVGGGGSLCLGGSLLALTLTLACECGVFDLLPHGAAVLVDICQPLVLKQLLRGRSVYAKNKGKPVKKKRITRMVFECCVLSEHQYVYMYVRACVCEFMHKNNM